MNTCRRIAIAVAGLALGLCTAAAMAIDVGAAAPEVDLPGTPVARSLAELKGKVVYVDFWASWCGPCKQSFPWMNEMQRKYGERGLQVVAINVDAKRTEADAFLAQNPPAFAVAFDGKGESARRLGVKAMPTSVLVGADGKVLFVHQGFRSEDRAELEGKLSAALATKPAQR